MNYDRLIKLMMMTTSSHDGECLNAIRMANARLAEENMNWEEILKAPQPQQRRRPAPWEESSSAFEDSVSEPQTQNKKYTDPEIDMWSRWHPEVHPVSSSHHPNVRTTVDTEWISNPETI